MKFFENYGFHGFEDCFGPLDPSIVHKLSYSLNDLFPLNQNLLQTPKSFLAQLPTPISYPPFPEISLDLLHLRVTNNLSVDFNLQKHFVICQGYR